VSRSNFTQRFNPILPALREWIEATLEEHRTNALPVITFDFPRHWVAKRNGRMVAALTWKRSSSFADSLWLASPMDVDNQAVQAYAHHIKRTGLFAQNVELLFLFVIFHQTEEFG